MTPPDGVAAGSEVRALAARLVQRVDEDGAYANLLWPSLLAASQLDLRDRALATELAYGTVRMRAACQWAVDRFLERPPSGAARSLLLVGAYQLLYTSVPQHAAVSATVGAAPRRARGLVNAVLRRVCESVPAVDAPEDWPDEATRLSYPSWILERLAADLGTEEARRALEAMNRPPPVVERADGYVQDSASVWVAEAVGADPSDLVVDLCAAPGGKATALANTGAMVLALDRSAARIALVERNARRLDLRASGSLQPVVADARRPPLRSASATRVLLDAPCSGLGALRRRPDARWRVQPRDVQELAALQVDLAQVALDLVAPGGLFVYSVCTMTRAETVDVDDALRAAAPAWEALAPPCGWRELGRGGLVLPHDHDTDGMYLLRLRAPGGDG